MTDFRTAGACACLTKDAGMFTKLIPGVGVAMDAYDGYQDTGVGGAMASAGGAAAGAAIGTAIFPGVGTLAGLAIGTAGSLLGGMGGRAISRVVSGKKSANTGARTGQAVQHDGGGADGGPLASIQPGYGTITGLQPQ